MAATISHEERRLQKLVREYQELNSADIDEVSETPSALDLARQIGLNRPLLIRGYARRARLPALEWTRKSLEEKFGHSSVSIAVTPSGNADSVVDEYFVEPIYEQMSFSDFLQRVGAPVASPVDKVVYLQSQDGNLSGELKALLPDIGDDIPLATAALGRHPDAVNLWIGDDRSVTSLHKDPYENFYAVLTGNKIFTLYPPAEFYCMHERPYPTARYRRRSGGQDSMNQWHIEPTDSPAVPWIPVDPLKPDYDSFPRFQYARSMTVEVSAGDLLYLPALWFHHVQQQADSVERMVVACNWWYDMEYAGSAHTLSRYVRSAVLALDGRFDEEQGDDND